MSRSRTDLNQTVPTLDQCKACQGRGVVVGVFHELDCLPCDGIGWLPLAGSDLAQVLGRTLTRMINLNKVLQAANGEPAQQYYVESGRAGLRGNYVGD